MVKFKIDHQTQVLLFALTVSTLLFDNGFFIFVPLSVVLLLAFFLHQPYKPGVFTVLAIQHYLQIAAGIWLCNYLGKEINYNTASRTTATMASMIGLVFLLVPVIYVQFRLPVQTRTSLTSYARQFSSQRVFILYVILYFFTNFLSYIALASGGLAQIIISLVKIKWIFFLLFGYLCYLKKENKWLFFFCVLFEFLSGFLSVFSNFKTVIYFLVILLLPLFDKLDIKQVVFGILIGVFMGTLAIMWTAIKGEYRQYLSGGVKGQIVSDDISTNESLDKIYELSNKVNSSQVNTAVVSFLDRLQYTYHFAKTIDRVPEVIPFQDGANWLDDLEFATTPRFLNPDKPIFDATEKTKKYTGLRYLGRDQGVSFSLGYFPECYIDFGLYGMMFMLLALGVLYALLYRYFLKKSSGNILFNYCVACAFFLEFSALEMDATYLLGRLFSSVVTFMLLVRFVFPAIIDFISVSKEMDDSSIALNT